MVLRRGFVMGLWNAHTSVGNIMGSLVAGYYVESSWGAAFIMPGLLIMMGGTLVFFTLIERPEDVQLQKCDGKSPHMGSPNNRMSSSRTLSESCVGKWSSTERLDRDALLPEQPTGRAITFWEALCLPNVLAYSILLFFAKLISYTFLYWLPNYISVVDKGRLTAERAAQLSVVFDLGGILGGMLAGLLSDSKIHTRGLPHLTFTTEVSRNDSVSNITVALAEEHRPLLAAPLPEHHSSFSPLLFEDLCD
ncbi:MFS transporter, OPA family, solute carrier family 37, member 1/2 [Paragonimus westermani]|uniref:MFS transporter, OPA family, solute carrier family 37, member 1/2 n=1 Tax=Paragonimus westermani TaxID=34504 RepID=A0A5J4N9L4_9TREM|nr:MFS transporter, OPA family, solute carrier family 37, member 1/2 [Paragonimus westermani]